MRKGQKFGYNILVETCETLPFPFRCYGKFSFLMIEKRTFKQAEAELDFTLNIFGVSRFGSIVLVGLI